MVTYNVFVYGSLLRGLGNHPVIADAEYLGECEAPAKYTMRSLGGFPRVIHGGSTPIKGELYRVNDVILEGLDCLEGHPHFYKREVVDVSDTKAWMYLLPEEEYDHCPLVGGDWRAYVNGTGD